MHVVAGKGAKYLHSRTSGSRETITLTYISLKSILLPVSYTANIISDTVFELVNYLVTYILTYLFTFLLTVPMVELIINYDLRSH